MPFFLILSPDRTDVLDDRIALRQDHIDYWTSKPGVVKVAGAMLDGDQPTGSAFLIEAADLGAAQALLYDDPFMKQAIFSGESQIVAMRPTIGDWLPKP
jgi:uncharacterized protein YciI